MLLRLTVAAILLLTPCLYCACAAPRAYEADTPQAQTATYPPVIEPSSLRQQATADAWQRLLAEYRLPDAPLELEPILYTPRSLPLAVAGQINLNSSGGELSAEAAKEALRHFIERAHAVLSGDQRAGTLALKDLSLVTFSDEGNLYRAVYQQMNFPWPLAGGFGEIRLVLSKSGQLLQLSSRIISPLLLSAELPARASVDSRTLIEPLLGREFTYSSIAGETLTYKVSERNEISVEGLVVYPKAAADRISLHLAWQIMVGRGTNWTIYVDAMTGKELEVKQNFVS